MSKTKPIKNKKPGDLNYGKMELKVDKDGVLKTLDDKSPLLVDMAGKKVCVISEDEFHRVSNFIIAIGQAYNNL